MCDLVFKPIKQLASTGEVRHFGPPDAPRLAVWNPQRGWVPVWNGSETVRKPR